MLSALVSGQLLLCICVMVDLCDLPPQQHEKIFSRYSDIVSHHQGWKYVGLQTVNSSGESSLEKVGFAVGEGSHDVSGLIALFLQFFPTLVATQPIVLAFTKVARTSNRW